MAAPTTQKPPGLGLDFLPYVDMTTLSQSELRTLSFCSSSSSFDYYRNDDIITPTIDRLFFNESTGSYRQTYSRPSSHHHHRHRLAGLPPKSPNPPSPRPPASSNKPLTDSDRQESLCIISFLKKFLSDHPEFQQLDLVDFDRFSHLNDAINFTSEAPGAEMNLGIGENKRKRGRELKVNVELEIVNKNGVVVDLESLASSEDPYKEELRRITEGMDKEEELLGFFGELGGQWCSRRRKRKIVDANEFGDALPVGWKLLLALKRKEGRAWVYCRRYISPGGQHFVSCKEVSKYLQSFFDHYDARKTKDYAGVKTQQIHKLDSEKEDQRQSVENEKAVALVGIENLDLAEVQIHDLFECYKCNMKFHEKDPYLQHVLSFHQRTTRRYRIGSSIGDSVIVKDGKYECQFCHKVFDERGLYISHVVGIHVRTSVKKIEDSPGDTMDLQERSDSPTKDELPVTGVSKMDALIEIAQNSIRETSPGLDDMAPNPELLASVSDHELKSNSSPIGPCIESSMEPHQQKVDYMIVDEITQKIDDSGIVLKDKIDSSGNELELGKSVIEPKADSECYFLVPSNNKKPSSNETNVELDFVDKHDKFKVEDVDKTRSVEIEVDAGSNKNLADNNIVKEILEQPLKDDGLSHGVPQLHLDFTTVSLDEIDLSAMDKRDEKITVFEDLKFDEIEQLKFSFKTEIPVPMNFANNSTGQFESDLTIDDAGGQHFTTICVWCGIEFIHEAAEQELQCDSVGYMCPSCKENISGTLNMWGGACS